MKKKERAAKTSLIRDYVARKIDSPYIHVSCHEVSKNPIYFSTLSLGTEWTWIRSFKKFNFAELSRKNVLQAKNFSSFISTSVDEELFLKKDFFSLFNSARGDKVCSRSLMGLSHWGSFSKWNIKNSKAVRLLLLSPINPSLVGSSPSFPMKSN